MVDQDGVWSTGIEIELGTGRAGQSSQDGQSDPDALDARGLQALLAGAFT